MAHPHNPRSTAHPVHTRTDPLLRSGLSRLIAVGVIGVALWTLLFLVMQAS